MTESVKVSLQAIKNQMPEATATSDEASQLVREIEKQLEGLEFSAEVGVDYKNTSPKTSEYTNLAYTQIGKKFRIAVVREQLTDFKNDQGYAAQALKTLEETPWLECSRAVKMATLSRIPALLESLLKTTVETIDKAKQAMPFVHEALGKLKK